MYINPDMNKGNFVKPEFESDVIEGIPENLSEEIIIQEVMIKEGFSLAICTNPIIDEDNNIQIYFISESDNEVWQRFIIYDEMGNELGETGIIRPGEYLQSTKLNRSLNDNENIVVKIVSFEPETYYSCGSADLVIQTQS